MNLYTRNTPVTFTVAGSGDPSTRKALFLNSSVAATFAAEPPADPPEMTTVTAEEYKKLLSQYNGLKGYADKLKADSDAYKARQEALAQEYEQKLSEQGALLRTLEGSKGQVETELETIRRKAAELERYREVGKLVAEKYPSLTPLHLRGVLNPSGEGEELESSLAAFEAAISDISAPKAPPKTGVVPPSPAGGVPASSNNAANDYLILMEKYRPGTPEYKDAAEKYYAALKVPAIE